jgi:RNA polymerase sigma-70 factor (ECF subfamily)
VILRDVLDWPAAQVADLLDTTTTAVNSGLRRARAQLAHVLPAEDELAEPSDPNQRALLDRFAAAFENGDIGALAELLREDAVLEMPPVLTWFTGRQTVAQFLGQRQRHLFAEPGRFRMVATMANGQPAFAAYWREDDGVYRAHGVIVLTTTRAAITRIVIFLDPALFTAFDLPQEYGGDAARPDPHDQGVLHGIA